MTTTCDVKAVSLHVPGTRGKDAHTHRLTNSGTTDTPGAHDMARWICDYCGATGHLPEGQHAEQVNCPVCGEPVLSDG